MVHVAVHLLPLLRWSTRDTTELDALRGVPYPRLRLGRPCRSRRRDGLARWRLLLLGSIVRTESLSLFLVLQVEVEIREGG